MKNQKDKIILLFVLVILSSLFLKDVIFSKKMLFGTDWLSGAYMQRDFFERSIKSDGQFPLWNPFQFAGIPTGEGFFGEIFNPLTLPLKYIFPTFVVWTLIFFIHMIIAGFGMYLYLLKKIRSKFSAGVFSIVFMFTSVMLSEIYGGHDGRFMVISYLPFLIYCIDNALERISLKWFLLSAIPAALMLLTGHIQSSYYAIIFSLFYVVFNHINSIYTHRIRNWTFVFALIFGFLFSFIHRYIGFSVFLLIIIFLPALLDKKMKTETIRIYLYLFIFVAFTFALALIQYLPIMRFLPSAARGIERNYVYAVSWSMGFPDILDQFVSGFAGINLNQTNTYWGENAFKIHSTYIGIIPLIFALAMLFSFKKKNITLFFSISLVTAFVLALGGNTPLYRIFYSTFPYVDKFRAPELIFFIASFSTIVLMALIFEEEKSDALLYTASAAGLFGLLILLFPQIVIDIFRESAGEKYEALKRAVNSSSLSAFKTILFAIAAFFSFKLYKGKMKNYILFALSILIITDLWVNNARFIIPVDSPDKYFAEDNIVKTLKQDNEIYRIFSFGYRNDDYLTLHGFEIISGNHPSPFADYQKFINNGESVMFNPEKIFMVANRLKFLNVKYAVVPFIPTDTAGYDDRSKNMIIYYNSIYNSMGFKNLKRVNNYAIMILNDYLPRAFCIDSYLVTENFDSVLTIIDGDKNCGIDYAIFNEDPKIKDIDGDIRTEISFVKYSPNRIEINVKSNKECMLIILDQYYKPWKCSVNNSPEKIYKAFGLFRGMKVNKGNNNVILWFDPTLQIFSAIVSLLTLAFILLFALLKKT